MSFSAGGAISGGHRQDLMISKNFVSHQLTVFIRSFTLEIHEQHICAVESQIHASDVVELTVDRDRADNKEDRQTELENHQDSAQPGPR